MYPYEKIEKELAITLGWEFVEDPACHGRNNDYQSVWNRRLFCYFRTNGDLPRMCLDGLCVHLVPHNRGIQSAPDEWQIILSVSNRL